MAGRLAGAVLHGKGEEAFPAASWLYENDMIPDT